MVRITLTVVHVNQVIQVKLHEITDSAKISALFHQGSRCETVLSPCDSGPCSFGRCVASVNMWTCACDPGWTGLQCKDGINECASNPCLNAGVCIDGIDQYRCICLTGYTGANCEVPLNGCSSVPCRNNGKYPFETLILVTHRLFFKKVHA